MAIDEPAGLPPSASWPDMPELGQHPSGHSSQSELPLLISTGLQLPGETHTLLVFLCILARYA